MHGVSAVVIIVFFVLVLNLFIFLRRADRSTRRKGKGRTYLPPDEVKRAIWRDREIAHRIEREDGDAFERVKLRNETLALYEKVRQRHAKKDALERLGIEVDNDKLDELKGLGLDENYKGK